MCGGAGFIIGTIVFFAWKDSEAGWKKTIAYICAGWMILSLAVYACVFLTY